MSRRKNPLISLILTALVVVGGLVGYTKYKTGEYHIWPSLVGEKNPMLAEHKKQLKANKKRIEKLQSELVMGGAAIPRDEIEQEIADLEEKNRQLQIKIDRY